MFRSFWVGRVSRPDNLFFRRFLILHPSPDLPIPGYIGALRDPSLETFSHVVPNAGTALLLCIVRVFTSDAPNELCKGVRFILSIIYPLKAG